MNVPGSRDEGTKTMVMLVLVSMFSSLYVLSFVLVLSGSIFLSCPFFFFFFVFSPPVRVLCFFSLLSASLLLVRLSLFLFFLGSSLVLFVSLYCSVPRCYILSAFLLSVLFSVFVLLGFSFVAGLVQAISCFFTPFFCHSFFLFVLGFCVVFGSMPLFVFLVIWYFLLVPVFALSGFPPGFLLFFSPVFFPSSLRCGYSLAYEARECHALVRQMKRTHKTVTVIMETHRGAAFPLPVWSAGER